MFSSKYKHIIYCLVSVWIESKPNLEKNWSKGKEVEKEGEGKNIPEPSQVMNY